MRLSSFPNALLAILLAACTRPGAGVGPAPATPQTVDLVVAATTDVHGRARGWDYYENVPDSLRGLTRAATIVDSLRAANPGRVVLFDAGDLIQGNPLAFVAARVDTLLPHPLIAAMRVMGYDAAVVGNHEFNYGLQTLARAIREADFPFLAANAWTVDGHRAFPAMRIVDRAGLRVALIGATTPGSMLWDRDNLRGRLVIHDIVPDVKVAVDSARAAGADVIVVGLHAGLDEPSSYDTVTTGVPSENVAARVAHEVPGIDLIVYGHSHKQMADTLIGTTLLVQPKNWATSVAVAHLTVATVDGHRRVMEKHGALIPAVRHVEQGSVLAATEAMHARTVAWATTPLGTTPVAWRSDSARVRDTPLIDFVLEVERAATGAQLASTAAYDIGPALGPGPVTAAQVSALYPYDNTLRAIRISGQQLRAYLEHSARYYAAPGGAAVVDRTVPGYNFDIVAGVDYALDIARPIGQRVTRLEYRGRPVADTDSFTLALNNYRQSGGGGYAMLAGAPVVYDQQQDIRQLLIDEVRRRGTLRYEDYFHQNWTIGPDSLTARALTEMSRPRRATPAPARTAGITGRRLRIIATNDVHGALEMRPDANGVRRGGAAYLATMIHRAAAECAPPDCQSILLDGGDEFQGTMVSNLAFGRPVVDIFTRLGYAASALGNHEFDWGQDTLRARMRQAPYRILGANARTDAGGDVPWIPNDTIVTRGSLRIGVIGLATIETKRTTMARGTVGLQFVNGAPIVDSIATALRRRGADVIVVVAHAGAFCDRDGSTNCRGEVIDLASALRSHVDAIVSGHTHSLVRTVVNGIPIVQARARSTALGIIDVAVGDTVGRRARIEVRDVLADSVPADTAIATFVERAVARVRPLAERRIATLSEDASPGSGESKMGMLIADAMRVEGHADAAFMNNGGIRTMLHAGVVTYGDAFEVQPFGNQLYRVTVRGIDLQRYLERRVSRSRPDVNASGVRVTYDSTAPAGARVRSVEIGGHPLDPAHQYTVVINDFMLTGGDNLGFGAAAIESSSLNLVDLDAFVAYLGAQPQPVAVPSDARFIPVSTP